MYAWSERWNVIVAFECFMSSCRWSGQNIVGVPPGIYHEHPKHPVQFKRPFFVHTCGTLDKTARVYNVADHHFLHLCLNF